MKSVWQTRRKEAFAKDRKRIKDVLAAKSRDPAPQVSEDRADEEVTRMHKKALRSHSTRSLSGSLDMKPKFSPTIAAASALSNISRDTVKKAAQATESFISPHRSPHTCEIDTLDSDDESIISYVSNFSFHILFTSDSATTSPNGLTSALHFIPPY